MNNEEKILLMLEIMNDNFEKLNEKVGGIETDMQEVKQDVKETKTRLTNVETR